MPKSWHQRQKERGVKLILTWFEPRQCWKKYRSGKTRYFHHPNSAAGYEAAVAEYHVWLTEEKSSRALAPEHDHHLDLLGKCLDWYDRFGVPDGEEELQDAVREIFHRIKETRESNADLPDLAAHIPDELTQGERQFIIEFCLRGMVAPNEQGNVFDARFGSIGWKLNDKWEERVRHLDELAAHGKKEPQTVGHQVNRFLDSKEKLVHAGVNKARTWGTLAERLPFFVSWIKPGTHVSTIDGTTVTGFYEWTLAQASWNHQRAKGIFNTARQWIRWAWRQDDVELEELPRNIDSREFVFLTHLDETGISKETRTDKLWTLDDFRSTLQLVPEDFKLFLLLMLNCGFTNEDIASLLKSEVRLEEGRIVRQRGKTRRHAHPPVVNYKLWPTTAELFRKRWSEHPTLALTNSQGRPLGVSRLVKEAGKTKEVLWTAIGRRYQQMKRAVPKKKKRPPLPDKELKFLRKTGSTKIRSKREFLSLDSLYLGHSWATVADKHYNAFDGLPYPPLDEAITWLGSEFAQCESGSES
jgi:integrase